MTVPVVVAYTWLLTAGTWDLFQRQYFDNFFDAQARSMLDGRLDVPPEVVGFEGFLIGGKTFIYFGPVPALLRMPLMLVTDRFDGRLTTVSMLLAMLVLSMAGFRLACAIRGRSCGAPTRWAGVSPSPRRRWPSPCSAARRSSWRPGRSSTTRRSPGAWR